jgi:hypothetical protein
VLDHRGLGLAAAVAPTLDVADRHAAPTLGAD